MTKKERQRFANRAREILLAQGARQTYQYTNAEKRTHYEFEIDSKFGPLRLSVYPRDTSSGGPGDVMTRFDFAKIAAGTTGCNPHSGKWNHHYFDGWTTDSALEDLGNNLERIRATSPEEFAVETSIVPQAIVETVLAERSLTYTGLCDPPYAFAGDDGLQHSDSVTWFVRHVDRRLRFLFDTNRRMNRTLCGSNGLEIAYAFIEHWLDAYIDNQLEYRKKHSLLLAQ